AGAQRALLVSGAIPLRTGRRLVRGEIAVSEFGFRADAGRSERGRKAERASGEFGPTTSGSFALGTSHVEGGLGVDPSNVVRIEQCRAPVGFWCHCGFSPRSFTASGSDSAGTPS